MPSLRSLGPIWTIPNLISLARLACIPLFLYLLLGLEDRVAAAVLLGVLGATDWVDGYLARRLHQVSDLGKILDPTADRLLFLVAIVAMMIDGSVPLWFGALSLAREAVVAGVAITLAALGARRLDVSWWGKTGTFGLMFTFPGFLLGASDIPGADIFQTLSWVVGIPSLLISYYAAFEYLGPARDALREGRAQRERNRQGSPSTRG